MNNYEKITKDVYSLAAWELDPNKYEKIDMDKEHCSFSDFYSKLICWLLEESEEEKVKNDKKN